MYVRIKQEIQSDYYLNNFSNDGQRFVVWYLRNIHNLDGYEAKECLTDGAGDKQIDAVYVDHQLSTVFIIQGKFYSGESINAEPLREVLSSWMQIKDLANLQDGANEKLKIKISEISSALDEDYEVVFELVTTSSLSDSANHDLEVFQSRISEDETINATIIVVDSDVLEFKYDEALNKSRPYINHQFPLESGKYMELMIGDTKAIIVALALKDCVKIPGIKDGSLFRKNVRQSLGANNKVNKAIARTIKNNANEFFFLHNGITAICSKMEIIEDSLFVKELNVVNGCQSLNTIYSCSEYAKKAQNAYILFRFYEIEKSERADNISTSTNSQSAVKARDLRSNDKSVLKLKKEYEQQYTDGYFITKRGEKVDTAKYNTSRIVNLTDLGKELIAWHSQRPTISYSETKIFDKYFDQLFHRDYSPECVQALNAMFCEILSNWTKDNPMGLNETLLAMKAYAPYHQLYAISVIVCEINKMHDCVPNPAVVYDKLKASNSLDSVVKMAGQCLNMAMSNASSESTENGKIFVPQNWVKSKASLKDIRTAVRQNLAVFKMVPEGMQMITALESNMEMDKDDFESRWTAD